MYMWHNFVRNRSMAENKGLNKYVNVQETPCALDNAKPYE